MNKVTFLTLFRILIKTIKGNLENNLYIGFKSIVPYAESCSSVAHSEFTLNMDAKQIQVWRQHCPRKYLGIVA